MGQKELYEAMNFVPWLIGGPVARPEAGGTPTLGCKACDAESSGVNRPFSVSNFERLLLVMLQLRWSLLLVPSFCGRA